MYARFKEPSITFEEMITYNLIENYFSSYGPNSMHQERFMATQLEEVDHPLPSPLPQLHRP